MISAQNLADRYGISKTAILKFVRSNIDVINKEKENAYQSGTKVTGSLPKKQCA